MFYNYAYLRHYVRLCKALCLPCLRPSCMSLQICPSGLSRRLINRVQRRPVEEVESFQHLLSKLSDNMKSIVSMRSLPWQSKKPQGCLHACMSACDQQLPSIFYMLMSFHRACIPLNHGTFTLRKAAAHTGKSWQWACCNRLSRAKTG